MSQASSAASSNLDLSGGDTYVMPNPMATQSTNWLLLAIAGGVAVLLVVLLLNRK